MVKIRFVNAVSVQRHDSRDSNSETVSPIVDVRQRSEVREKVRENQSRNYFILFDYFLSIFFSDVYSSCIGFPVVSLSSDVVLRLRVKFHHVSRTLFIFNSNR